MKRLISALILGLAAIIMMPSCAAQKHFQEVAEIEGVSSVYISGAMVKMAGGLSTLGNFGMGLDGVAMLSKVDGIEIIECDDADKIKKVAAMCESRIASLNLDIVMEANEDGEKVKIYSKLPEDSISTMANSLIVYCKEESELTLVYIRGKIDLRALNVQ